MKKPYRILLVVSYLLTIFLFWLDDDDGPYPISEMITDFLLAGTIYTALFFGFLSGVYYLSSLDIRKLFHKKSQKTK